MALHSPEERKTQDAIQRITMASERQAEALEKIAEALTTGPLSAVVNLLEQIDVTIANKEIE